MDCACSNSVSLVAVNLLIFGGVISVGAGVVAGAAWCCNTSSGGESIVLILGGTGCAPPDRR